MQIEFDPKKDAGNLAKHGVSLGMAYELDWNAALVWVDDRFECGELRMIAFAPRTNTLYYGLLLTVATSGGSSACGAPPGAR